MESMWQLSRHSLLAISSHLTEQTNGGGYLIDVLQLQGVFDYFEIAGGYLAFHSIFGGVDVLVIYVDVWHSCIIIESITCIRWCIWWVDNSVKDVDIQIFGGDKMVPHALDLHLGTHCMHI
jgi:hypothetical protein